MTDRLEEIEGRLANYKIGGADNVSTLFNHAPADIAYLVAEVRRLNLHIADFEAADAINSAVLHKTIERMREV